MKEQTTNNYGVSFVGLLQVAFIVLKLCNVINWSWWLVLLPTIISGGLVVLLFILSVVLTFIKLKK